MTSSRSRRFHFLVLYAKKRWRTHSIITMVMKIIIKWLLNGHGTLWICFYLLILYSSMVALLKSIMVHLRKNLSLYHHMLQKHKTLPLPTRSRLNLGVIWNHPILYFIRFVSYYIMLLYVFKCFITQYAFCFIYI